MSLEELQQQEWYGLAMLILLSVALGIIYVTVSGGYHHYAQLRNRLRFWEESMGKKIRSRYEKRVLCDIIASAFEDAEYEGKISRETKVNYYQQFANNCGLYELLPRKHRPREIDLKENLRERLGADVDKKLAEMRARRAATVPKKPDNNLVMLQARLKKSA